MATHIPVPVSVPFSHFINLLIAISDISPQRKISSKSKPPRVTPLSQVEHWLDSLKKSSVIPDTWAVVLRLLFPEEDVKRRYGMQEKSLADALKQYLCLSHTTFDNWRANYSCLGAALQAAIPNTFDESRYREMSINNVDDLLDELAASCPYSDGSIRHKYPLKTRRKKPAILKALFRPLPPRAAGFLAQILLQDMRPMLYPLPPDAAHYTSALNHYNSNSIQQLTKESVMRLIDPSYRLNKMYKVTSHLDLAADAIERGDTVTATVGSCFEVPKSQKGRGCQHALTYFPTDDMYAEIKYDGERAQIHVQVSDRNTLDIKIFSKSRRDSTLDRNAVHETVRDGLGLAHSDNPKNIRNIILDAEMVAFDGLDVDEFWRIDGLVTLSAMGPRARKDLNREISCEEASQVTHSSPSRHLGLIFFDIILLNSVDLRTTPYEERRDILESIIVVTPGSVQLAERFPIYTQAHTIREAHAAAPLEQLKNAFAHCISNHHEGLVLKGRRSGYGDYRAPWVKLKKDYIPGHGDCMDMIVFGAGYERDRAAELGLPPSGFTTFYLGAVRNATDIAKDPTVKPEVYIYLASSYGLTREQLENATFLLKNSNHVIMPTGNTHPAQSTFNLPYEFKLRRGFELPTILLRHPLVAEVYGAGFTKEQHCSAYSLRFPRITKIHRAAERSWLDCMSLDEIHSIARAACGRDPPDKDIDNKINEIWGHESLVSPGIKASPKKRKRKEEAKSMLDLVDPPSPDTKKMRKREVSREEQEKPMQRWESTNKQPLSGDLLLVRNLQGITPSSIQQNEVDPVTPNLRVNNLPDESPPALRSPFTPKRPSRRLFGTPTPPGRPTILSSSDGSPARTEEISTFFLPSPHPELREPEGEPNEPSLPLTVSAQKVPKSGPECLSNWRQMSKEMQKLLYRSVVWFVLPLLEQDVSKESRNMTRKNNYNIEDPVQIDSFQEFLTHINWTSQDNEVESYSSLEGVCRGIIFVDVDCKMSQDRLEEVVGTVDELLDHTVKSERKALWVFSLNALRLDVKQPKELFMVA